MSNYQNRIDFISRTRQILVQYEHNCNSEKTLFMNCCVGLLIMPQQCADHDKNISVDGLVDYENWGIDTTKITANEHRKGVDKNSIENIAYHIRNSICHYQQVPPNYMYYVKDCSTRITAHWHVSLSVINKWFVITSKQSTTED